MPPESKDPLNPHWAPEINQALVALCASVVPEWARQLATAQTQAETARLELLAILSTMESLLNSAESPSHQKTAALTAQGSDIAQLALACENELTPLLGESKPHVVTAIRRVVGLIRQAVEVQTPVVANPNEVNMSLRQQLLRMKIGFQDQDRLSQRMTLLHEDMAHLQAILAAPGSDPHTLSPQAWLAQQQGANPA